MGDGGPEVLCCFRMSRCLTAEMKVEKAGRLVFVVLLSGRKGQALQMVHHPKVIGGEGRCRLVLFPESIPYGMASVPSDHHL